MMTTYLPYLISTFILLFLFITYIRTALINLNWAILKDPKIKQKKLKEKVEKWLHIKDNSIFFLDVIISSSAFAVFLLFYKCIPIETPKQVVILLIIILALLIITIKKAIYLSMEGDSHIKILFITMPIIYMLSLLTLPISLILKKISLWHTSQKSEREENTTKEDKIISIIEQDEYEENEQQYSDLEDDERRMIKGIFDLDETLVKEIMTPRVDIDAVDVNDTIQNVKKMIIEKGHSRVPVYHETLDDIIGIIFAKDLLDSAKVGPDTKLRKIMRTPDVIPETKNLDDLLEDFQRNKQHFAVILDEYGGTSGIITLEDILEEIVGEIMDEYDRDEEPISHKFNPDSSIDIDARCEIDDLNEILKIDIEKKEYYDTLGGYITYSLGRIPRQGEKLETDELSVNIIEANNRCVLKARLIKKEDEENKNNE